MRILVTGGAGDIGAYVVRELASHGSPPAVLDMRLPRSRVEAVDYVQCDLMNLQATLETVDNYDLVIHLAAIPHPYSDPPDRVMAVNMVTCFNVLEAIRRNGIRRIIYACSDSASGFGIHNVELMPLYLPVDERHPCWPHESYSLTKRFGEEMVEAYARAYGIEAISLRYCWVWLERDAPAVRKIVQARLHGRFETNSLFCGYISPNDVARAVRAATSYRFPSDQAVPFEAFYLAADSTYNPEPTLEALSRRFDPLPEMLDPEYFVSNPFASALDTRKAKRLLGFRPTDTWDTYDQWERTE